MIGFLDTSVVVDLLRSYPAAENWLQSQNQLAVSRAVWIEVLQGVPDSKKQRAALKILRHFELIDLTAEDQNIATNLLLQFSLSHGIDGYDCLIAAVCIRMNLPLYTHNLKHFSPILGSQAIKPY